MQQLAGSASGRCVAFLVGALLVVAFAPFGWFWLALLVPACLLLLWEHADARQAAWTGFWFGFGLFAAGTWWLYISLNILGGLWPPLAVLLMLALVSANAAYIALTGFLVVRLAPTGNAPRWLLVFPALWTLTEWLRGWVLSGFPWMSLGYSQAESPLGAFAPLLGVYGVSWFIVLAAGLLVAAILYADRRRWLAVAGLIALVSSAYTLDGRSWTHSSDEGLQVRLVQGAIAQESKWSSEQRQPTLDLYRDLSDSDETLDLIVWPEAAVPALPFEVADFLQGLHDDMVERDTQLLLGILTYDIERDEFLNTLWAIGEEEGRYFKRHLVPFGEYFPVPDFVRRVMRLMNLPSENISAGGYEQGPLYAKGVPIAPTICYEIAYGAEQLSFFPEAQLLVNVSNDAWFGDTIAPYQHLQINQFRARETGRYLLRATNTGVTAIIDPYGRIVDRIPQFESGVVNAVVYPRSGQTLYLRFGNWLIIPLAVLLLGAGTLLARRSAG
jgi:apolipoprotein N-acyltransferase